MGKHRVPPFITDTWPYRLCVQGRWRFGQIDEVSKLLHRFCW